MLSQRQLVLYLLLNELLSLSSGGTPSTCLSPIKALHERRLLKHLSSLILLTRTVKDVRHTVQHCLHFPGRHVLIVLLVVLFYDEGVFLFFRVRAIEPACVDLV